MKVKTEEFQIGKRHLARMMGENPETFSQEKIDVKTEHKRLFNFIKKVNFTHF
jgi:hypothetical protein